MTSQALQMGTQFIFSKVNIQKLTFLSGTKHARKVVVPEWAKIKDPDVILSEVIKLENNENITNEVGDPDDSDGRGARTAGGCGGA